MHLVQALTALWVFGLLWLWCGLQYAIGVASLLSFIAMGIARCRRLVTRRRPWILAQILTVFSNSCLLAQMLTAFWAFAISVQFVEATPPWFST